MFSVLIGSMLSFHQHQIRNQANCCDVVEMLCFVNNFLTAMGRSKCEVIGDPTDCIAATWRCGPGAKEGEFRGATPI